MFINVHNHILEIKPDGADNWLISTQRSSSPAKVNDADWRFSSSVMLHPKTRTLSIAVCATIPGNALHEK